jgi:hypothetical protein
MILPILRAGLLLAAALAPTVAAAKSISISIFPSAEVKDGVLTARVRVTNSGDEAAESVAPVLQFGQRTTRADARSSLGPNESMTAALSLEVGTLAPGRWPYRLAIDYTDANQYPFQALHMGVVTLGSSPPPAKISVSEVKAAPISSSGSLSVRVKNLAGVERKATLTVALPEGLEVAKPIDQVSLAAWEEATVSVPIVNRTALAGSRYPIFAAVEYDEDGVHQAVTAQAVVEIESPQSVFRIPGTTLWIVAGILVAAWLGFMLRQVTARRAA